MLASIPPRPARCRVRCCCSVNSCKRACSGSVTASSAKWEPYSVESFLVIATTQDNTGSSLRWQVDLAAGTVALASAAQADESGNPSWQVVG